MGVLKQEFIPTHGYKFVAYKISVHFSVPSDLTCCLGFLVVSARVCCLDLFSTVGWRVDAEADLFLGGTIGTLLLKAAGRPGDPLMTCSSFSLFAVLFSLS